MECRAGPSTLIVTTEALPEALPKGDEKALPERESIRAGRKPLVPATLCGVQWEILAAEQREKEKRPGNVREHRGIGSNQQDARGGNCGAAGPPASGGVGRPGP